ncbi:aldehyde dehydrogenase family protein [Flavobacteriaceae bacterium Ap0902]|nr:aldehyde dehydrogenase family protein [Flavobacteriaceae bacterium Ap0902]
MDIQNILNTQREFFLTNATKDISFRKAQLIKLKEVLKSNEDLLYEAIHKDFGKSKFDTYTTEISLIYSDIDYYIKNIEYLARPESVPTNLVNQVGFSSIYPEPLGSSLIIGAWNYPFYLSLMPLVAAMAAGNTVILKPSEVAEHTMHTMQQVLNDNFDASYLYCAIGGVPETTEILKLNFDKIFFTGSPRVGKIVYEAAAKNLTPVTLELGGKSPAIISENANLKVAAKRVVWGKFLNAGQTCVAPDYVYVDKKVKETFLNHVTSYLKKFDYKEDSEHYTKIINQKHFERLTAFIEKDKIVFGGNSNEKELYIQPTVMDQMTWDDEVMQEEIFGPILPILTFGTLDEAYRAIKSKPKPLAAYMFTNNRQEKEKFTEELSFGGGCINDTVMHLSNEYLPFGGVGNSGIGHYHGKHGFLAFSHQKSILHRATWAEPNLKYPPYSEEKLSWVKKVIEGIFK